MTTLESVPVIICAMDEEIQPFLDASTKLNPVTTPLSNAKIWMAEIDSTPVVLVRSGIGLVAASSTTSMVIAKYRPSLIISAGTAGGLAADINVRDVAVASSCTYGAADTTDFDYELGQVPGQPLRFESSAKLVAAATANAELIDGQLQVGRILSADSFVTARNVEYFRSAFPDAIATDMESCAIAQVCHAANIPFVSIRGISDLCGPSAGQDFHIGADEASAASAKIVLGVLESKL